MKQTNLLSVFLLLVVIAGTGVFIGKNITNVSNNANQAALAKTAATADSKDSCTITSFTNTPVSSSAKSSKLSWTSIGCKNMKLQPKDAVLGANAHGAGFDPITVLSNGSFVTPSILNPYTYTLSGTSSTGSTTPVVKSVTVSTSDQGVASPSCVINSFTVPTTTKLSAKTLAATIKTSNCDNVFAVINSGSYYQGYTALPANGAYTFTTQSFPNQEVNTYSKTDGTLDVTLFAGNLKNLTSVTKSVKLSDSTPSVSQCNLTIKATPSSVLPNQQVTLSWSAPDAPKADSPNGCIVYVNKFDAMGNYTNFAQMYKGTDSLTDTVSAPATYYVTAQAGVVNNFDTVLTAKTIDVPFK
jgi:hypothetical protein